MSKGNEFEWLIGKQLSLWMTDGEEKKELIRTVLSGGWSERDVPQVGDLAPNGALGAEFRLWCGVECKHYREGADGFSWWHIFTSETPMLEEWWTKHWGECGEYGLVPLIFMRINYRPILVGFPSTFPVPLKAARSVCIPYLNLSFITFEAFTSREKEWYYQNWTL